MVALMGGRLYELIYGGAYITAVHQVELRPLSPCSKLRSLASPILPSLLHQHSVSQTLVAFSLPP